ncbi:NAD(P)-binding protein [Pisolithus thermaeus]|nr:NAD(P)-binding protein [Pisolithus thermaeus]
MASEILKTPSASPIGPLGIGAALESRVNPAIQPRPRIFDEFAVSDHVALVSGGNRGLGLEAAIVLCEAGARVVYCLDLPEEPSEVFVACRDYVRRLGNNSRLEYFSADVRDQQLLWKKAEEICDKEQRLDIRVAAAGISKPPMDCSEYSAETFKEVIDVDRTGVFFTAQAAGRQMARFGRGGSIILFASVAGSVGAQEGGMISYGSAKSAALQVARSMACELGSKKIRMNSLSPGFIRTPSVRAF